MTSDSEPVADVVADNGAALHELQRRVQVLEDAVARLQDPQLFDDRFTERLAQTPLAAAAPPPPPDDPPVHQVIADAVSASWGGRWNSWLLIDMWREGRTLLRLIFDHRYSMAWSTRLICVIFLPLILTSHLWLSFLLCGFPWVEGLRGLLISAVNLVLAFVLYKALSREVQRYNEVRRHS